MLLGKEFDRGAEEVMKKSPFVTVEIIEQWDEEGLIETAIADPLANMSPVFLFNMGVVFFVVRAASCEVHGLFSLGEVAE